MNDLNGEEMPETARGWQSDMIIYLAMTKSVVKAMDVVQEFLKEEHYHEINGFLVAGGSKRGWVTWFTAVVEPKVISSFAKTS